MQCPHCDAEVEGRFCGFCGGSLEVRQCSVCESRVPTGHRFCSECGSEIFGDGIPTKSASGESTEDTVADKRAVPDGLEVRRRWWIIAAAVAGAAVFLGLPYVWTGWPEGGNGERVAMSPATSPPGLDSAPSVDLSSMTPREAADRLFNRVMAALAEGDQAEVEAFLPMAIDAYQLVPNLDADGHFHLSLLQQAGGDYQSGLETAEAVLFSDPDHLLALYAAGEAARELGETTRAREHFERLLEVFEVEMARNLPEYEEHANFLPTIRATAEDFLAPVGS